MAESVDPRHKVPGTRALEVLDSASWDTHADADDQGHTGVWTQLDCLFRGEFRNMASLGTQSPRETEN